MAARTLCRNSIQLTHPAPSICAFLHLASRRPLPVLNFLLPNAPFHTPRSSSSSQRFVFSTPTILKNPIRPFGTTLCRKETAAVYNPRKDDDGNEMTIEITPRASNRLKDIMAQDANPNLALRITVESGGCHGFQYLMSLTTLPPIFNSGPNSTSPNSSGPTTLPSNTSSVPHLLGSPSSGDPSGNVEIDPSDTVFQALDGSGAKVIMDSPSLDLLKGSKIDYTMELIGSQFKIVDNPLATSSCGCGTSFDIKA